MKKVTIFNKLALMFLLVIAMNFSGKAQSFHPLVPDHYVFDIDSLKGFDEEAAKQGATAIGAFGDEFKAYMYYARREFIQLKYNIPSAITGAKGANPMPTPAAAACNNEDFEAQSLTNPVPSTVVISTAGGLTGWTCSSGINSGSTGSCLLTGCCPSAPQAIRVISTNTATGLIDALIGPSYPIYSVFGNKANSGGTSTPGVLGIDTMRGDWFVKINEQAANAHINKISKTINVTPANALFQFAFISVLQSQHCCCDNTGFILKVKDCSNNVLSCPQFTASTPNGAGCSGGTGTPCLSAGNTTSYSPCPLNSGWSYNRWKVTTLDLTAYIGSCVTLDVIAVDCPYSGHAGYAYFDAQCLPMGILGNNTLFPAGTPNITLPTCGSGSTATITAPPGLTNYTWTGPGSFFATAQTITTSITGFYTLTMSPPGACAPITRTVQVVISPAPNLIVDNLVQFTCSQPTLNAASIQMASGTPGAGTPNYTVNWQPAPTATIGMSANTLSVGILGVGINTITIMDSVGCTATQTINVTPAPPVPSFSFATPSGTVLGCNPNTIPLQAINTSTNPLITNPSYTWTSITSGSLTGSNINGSVPSGTLNTYTVMVQDVAAGSCLVSQTISISQDASIPGCSVTPVGGTLTCGGGPVTFTATSTGTTNIDGYWFDSNGNVIVGPTGTPMLLQVTSPGTFVATFSNTINGCTNSKTVSVTANTIVPTMTINAPTGTKITCATPVLTLNITASPGPGPNTYTWTNMQTNVSTNPATGGYTVNAPGTYSAAYQDGFGCKVGQQITITIDTVRPSPSAITNLPSGSFTLNCYNPVMTASAVTNPMLPITSYSWVQPSPSLVVATHTMEVNTTSVTANPTTFTVLAANPNGCVGRSKVLFYEDLVVPVYKVVFTPTALTCQNLNVAVTPVYVSGPSTAANFTIASPPPTTTNTAPGSLFSIPGVYTATMQLLSNGCTVTAQTATVPINTTPPATVQTTDVSIPCGATTVNINAGTFTTSTAYQYAWDGPTGAGIGTPSANITSVDQVGVYEVIITNTVNGCTSTNSIAVTGNGTISAGFTADPTTGYAPLSVSFVNTSTLGATTGTNPVYTSWSYGNGSVTSGTATSANTSLNGLMNGSTTYSAAGVYTVTLYMTQSKTNFTCTSTSSLVITVDLPSKLTIPNVFTPNGDKVNDVFMVNSTNITEISCIIFDRWGVKMYDVTSKTGNIAWDGKNLSGKEVPVGTYFYIITATGLDDIPYEQKGTVSLYR